MNVIEGVHPLCFVKNFTMNKINEVKGKEGVSTTRGEKKKIVAILLYFIIFFFLAFFSFFL